jgi:phage baseplate assembly protein gpV
MIKKITTLLIISLLAGIASAANTVIWTGATDGNWAVAANWSTGEVPRDGNNVYLENSAVSITSGLAQSAKTLASLNISQSYTGQTGDDVNYLAIGATAVKIGYYNGPGIPAGSGRIKLDVGTAQTAITIYNSGQPVNTNKPAIMLLGTHAANTLEVRKGKVGIAFGTGEAATFATINSSYSTQPASDVGLTIGAGTTLTTLNQTGGENTLLCAATTITTKAGTLWIDGSGAITTLTIEGGTVTSNTTGTITAAVIKTAGTLDLTKSSAARTITTTKLDAGGTLKYDPAVMTLTNKVNSDNFVVLRAAGN